MIELIVVALWVLNFVISWLNAWGSGRAWNETKAVGGFAHLANWAGAVMSASGFTWCYTILLAVLGHLIPIQQDGGGYAPLVSTAMVGILVKLGYLIVIGPILGSGVIITINSWAHFWRERTFTDGAISTYNTAAQVYNIASAIDHAPDAFSAIKDFFTDDEKGKGTIVLVLVAIAFFGGILTTYTILQRARREAAERHYADYGGRDDF